MKYSPFHFSGGIWFGHRDLLTTFAVEYKEAVEIMLDEGLANCEEQVGLIAMQVDHYPSAVNFLLHIYVIMF